MDNIYILDCTLRDGGYINDWNFGHKNIISIISRLTNAFIDIVEVGFLEDCEYKYEYSMFSDVSQIEALLPDSRSNTNYVAMTRYGNLDINNLKDFDGHSINGIRVTFHEDQIKEAMDFCKEIKNKGYKVYVQPVGTTSYSDKCLLELIDSVNEIQPHAFYIVDTLGVMRENDLLKMYYLVDNNLDPNIVLGFHSHNNLQLSFSNAQVLAKIKTNRKIYIDASVHGMGRGAGNLNTELITQYLNTENNRDYNIDQLLEIVNESIEIFLAKYSWGYSVPYYLAAVNNCHPNYASYLINRKTLTVKSINIILKSIATDQRDLFNKKYIEQLYTQHQQLFVDDTEHLHMLSDILSNRTILILAPGSSIKDNINVIQSYINQMKPVVISVNYEDPLIDTDFYFFSNDKRYRNKVENKKNSFELEKMIITSNIQTNYYKYRVNYRDYLNSQPLVNDNATLMLLAVLIKLRTRNVVIAGFDGYHQDRKNNYIDEGYEIILDSDAISEMNKQIKEVVTEYKEKLNINFITSSLYETEGD